MLCDQDKCLIGSSKLYLGNCETTGFVVGCNCETSGFVFVSNCATGGCVIDFTIYTINPGDHGHFEYSIIIEN